MLTSLHSHAFIFFLRRIETPAFFKVHDLPSRCDFFPVLPNVTLLIIFFFFLAAALFNVRLNGMRSLGPSSHRFTPPKKWAIYFCLLDRAARRSPIYDTCDHEIREFKKI